MDFEISYELSKRDALRTFFRAMASMALLAMGFAFVILVLESVWGHAVMAIYDDGSRNLRLFVSIAGASWLAVVIYVYKESTRAYSLLSVYHIHIHFTDESIGISSDLGTQNLSWGAIVNARTRGQGVVVNTINGSFIIPASALTDEQKGLIYQRAAEERKVAA